MTVGVTLHHRADGRVRRNKVTNQLVVIDESWKRDFGPCGSRRHGFSLASRLFLAPWRNQSKSTAKAHADSRGFKGLTQILWGKKTMRLALGLTPEKIRVHP